VKYRYFTIVKCITQKIRAIGEKEKTLRRRNILNAARQIFSRSPESLPSVISIARASGLAKGTVYLYFKTKEEIFLAILADSYEELLDQLIALISQQEKKIRTVDLILKGLLDYIELHPQFMPLASMSSSIIERNVDINIVRDFKLMIVQKIDHIDHILRQQFPLITLPQGQYGRLLLHTNALVLGLWQMQNWPEHLASLKTQPLFSKIIPNFPTEVESSVRSLWAGSLRNDQANTY